MANVLLFAFDFCFRFRVTSTGHGALRTTRSAVLPSKRCFSPLCPRVERAIKSASIREPNGQSARKVARSVCGNSPDEMPVHVCDEYPSVPR